MICDDRSGSWVSIPDRFPHIYYLQVHLCRVAKTNRTWYVVDIVAATAAFSHLAAGRLLCFWWQYPNLL